MYKIIGVIMIIRILFLLWTIIIYKKLYKLALTGDIYRRLPYDVYTKIKIKAMSPAYILYIIPSVNLIATYRMICCNMVPVGEVIDMNKAKSELLTHSIDIQMKYEKGGVTDDD